MTSRFRSTFLSIGPLMQALAACGEESTKPAQPDLVVLSLAAVPEDVSCLRLTAVEATRSAVRFFDAKPGEPFSQTIGGLPTGSVTFTAEAFASACDSVRSTSVPTWTSEPRTATVSLGRLANVELTLNRNGRAKLELEFEGAAADGGV